MLKRSDGSWLVDGSFGIDEFEDRLGISGLRGSRTFDTVAGYALFRLGRLPVVGDTFTRPQRATTRSSTWTAGGSTSSLYRPRVEEEG